MLPDWSAAWLRSNGGAWIPVLAIIVVGMLVWVIVTRRR